MNYDLSPRAEQFLTDVVAQGQFPTKTAALEAAVEALREKSDEIPYVPGEHMEAVERGIEEANAGKLIPMTPEYWQRLRQIAGDASAGDHATC
jgi:hypothetical protein